MNCKKKTLKGKRKHQSLTKIITKTAENTLKDAVNFRNDTKMTTAVTDIDLIAKEFQKYEKCYREYTRIVREEALQEEHVDEEFIRGNYEVVLYMVKDYILADKQCISMETLQSAYGVGVGFRQSRHKLEERLRKTFGDKIILLCLEYRSPKLVISKESLQTQTLSNTLQVSNESTVKKAAFTLRDEVMKFIEELPESPWHPTVERLKDRASDIPKLLKIFYVHLLSTPEQHHEVSETVLILADTFSQDIVSAISRGKAKVDNNYSGKVGTLHYVRSS